MKGGLIEAKQWAIGDWLVDGKRHYRDGLYGEAEGITGIEQRTLEDLKRISNLFEITLRHVNLTWSHHREVASLRTIETVKDKKLPQGRMQWSNKPDHEKMQEFLIKAEKKEWSVRELRAEVETYKRNKELEFALHNSPQKYEIFYADPPWKYSDELIEGYGAVVHHYKPMTIQEICEIPVKEIVSENTVLFLWVTSPILDECFEVIRSWGFEYKAQFIWDKIKHNYGHYNSVRPSATDSGFPVRRQGTIIMASPILNQQSEEDGWPRLSFPPLLLDRLLVRFDD
jgi:hypothetical protein